jgi:hypothetical protein
MAAHTIRPETIERFEIPGLRIHPEIAGMSHAFTIEGKQVRITLPHIPEHATKGAFPSWTGNPSISYAGFKIVNGEHVPTVCHVDDVQLTLTAQADFDLPCDYVPTVPIPDMPDDIQQIFESLYMEHRQVAEHAFRYWRDVLRWKTLDGSLGRPPIVHQGLKHTVRDALADKVVFGGVIALQGFVDSREGVDRLKWTEIQNVFDTGAQVPVWFDFLFQGEYRRELGDFTEAVINFAIACELLIRRLLTQEFPDFARISTGATEIVDEVNIRTIINKWRRMSFWSKAWQGSFDIDGLHGLMDARNKVMHRGHTALSGNDSAKYAGIARKFVIAADPLVKSGI